MVNKILKPRNLFDLSKQAQNLGDMSAADNHTMVLIKFRAPAGVQCAVCTSCEPNSATVDVYLNCSFRFAMCLCFIWRIFCCSQ